MKSQENQNGAENTNRENRHIASLAVWFFGGAQFSTFMNGTAYKMMELKRNLSLATYLSSRKTYKPLALGCHVTNASLKQ